MSCRVLQRVVAQRAQQLHLHRRPHTIGHGTALRRYAHSDAQTLSATNDKSQLPVRPFAFVPPGSNLPSAYQPIDATTAAETTTSTTVTDGATIASNPVKDSCVNPYHFYTAANTSSSTGTVASSDALVDALPFPRPLPRIYQQSFSGDDSNEALPDTTLNTRVNRSIHSLMWVIILGTTVYIVLVLEIDPRLPSASGGEQPEREHVFSGMRTWARKYQLLPDRTPQSNPNQQSASASVQSRAPEQLSDGLVAQ